MNVYRRLQLMKPMINLDVALTTINAYRDSLGLSSLTLLRTQGVQLGVLVYDGEYRISGGQCMNYMELARAVAMYSLQELHPGGHAPSELERDTDKIGLAIGEELRRARATEQDRE